MTIETECPHCHGVGKQHSPGRNGDPMDSGVACERCEGSGVIEVDQTMAITRFTEKDKEITPILGPEYLASNRLAEAMLAKFDAEHLKPLVEHIAKEVRDKLWDDVRDWLLGDTENNVAGAVREMVEQTVTALLSGEEWAMQRYPFADYSKGEKVRAAVCKHGGDALMALRVKDLEAEVAKKDEALRCLRREEW